uniref:alpha-amylase n=1 Tax=Fundulus heteroclitus TaxID=8078 RepID=A0A3Q2QVQ5_FUNHE
MAESEYSFLSGERMKLLILVALFGLSLAQHNPQLKSGRTTIVHLFEWRWADIAAECERFLGPNGFGGVQVSREESMLVSCQLDHIAEQGLFTRNLTWQLILEENCVIDLGGESITSKEYFHLGRVTEFKYGAKLGTVFRKWNGEKLCYTKNWGEGWGFMPNGKAVVFIDNHDNQRGHGAGGGSIVTFWDSKLHKMAVAYMLAHPYGQARIMSSYRWNRNIVNGKDQNDWMGPPSNGDGSTKPVPINPDQTCGDGWVCEHRWRQIKNMVKFRNVVNGQPHVNWWDNQSNQVAFGCGNRGFIVFNNDNWALDVTLNTGLPAGTYCDVISGQKEGSRCTGKQIKVGSDGRAHFYISNTEQDPFIAIHANSKL